LGYGHFQKQDAAQLIGTSEPQGGPDRGCGCRKEGQEIEQAEEGQGGRQGQSVPRSLWKSISFKISCCEQAGKDASGTAADATTTSASVSQSRAEDETKYRVLLNRYVSVSQPILVGRSKSGTRGRELFESMTGPRFLHIS